MNLGVAQSPEELRFTRAREALIAYLRMKVDLADWHGVADAACDLRVLEAEHGSQKTLDCAPHL